MNKLILIIKKTTYLNLSNSRRLVASMAIIGSLSPFMAVNVPAAMAERVPDSSNAFLTVQNLSADENGNNGSFLQNNIFIAANSFIARISGSASAPASVPAPVVKTAPGKVVIVTAYSSTPDQTDNSPFITANGTFVRDGIVAANFLPFGTKIRFPEFSGDKVFTVTDRMAKKHNNKIDIWMTSRGAALQFGVKKLAYEVVLE
ncbi:MAG: hypothetical protein PHT44_01330 [Candidatus Portnoybacteria bacterium]|nr:hypothetical protein [Candidatus Portnoybacteria bacterium]MDD4982760.1 hypothetical protein [Candidatus Portnoybacteria bacterium]